MKWEEDGMMWSKSSAVATEEGDDLEAGKLRMELHKASGELRKCGYAISSLYAWRAVEDTKHYIEKN